MSDILALQITVLGCAAVGFMASLRFVLRYLELRQERLLRVPPTDLSERLERIEQTVESTAIEVERISEANRFLSKLLAERTAPAAALGRTPERVITPH